MTSIDGAEPPARRLRMLALIAMAAVTLAGEPADADDAASRHSEEPSSRVRQALEELRLEFDFPGATAAWVLPDGTSGSIAVGFADRETAEPMRPQSRMLAASIGKTFVSATALALAQDGELDLDQAVAFWLGDKPWFDRLPNRESMTVRHLLMHTSGIGNHVDNPAFAAAFAKRWADAGTPLSPEMLIEYVLDTPPLFAPGTGWAYSDTGYVLVGMLIERASGASYYDQLCERFLDPLNLKQTSPSDRPDLHGLAAGYVAADNPFELPEKTTAADGRMVWNPAVEWTGGGVVSTSLDLARWAALLFEGRAMQGDYLGDLLRDVPVDGEQADVTYGAGVAIRKTGPRGPWYSHSGWIPGYVSSMRYYPEYRAAIAFQINTDVGIVDGSTTLFEDMAALLEELILVAPAD